MILGPKYLHLPRNTGEMRRKVSEFEIKFGMTQVYGCIDRDGIHIPLKRPPQNSQDYKQYFSLNIQAICDSKGYFMDVECKWPGSVHDAKMFANSSINYKMKTGQLPKTFITLLPGYEAIPNSFIGDPAYPLTPFCMKEYKSCVTNEEIVFNNMLRSARNQVECAFGRLKVRWGFLTRKVYLKLEMVPTVALAFTTTAKLKVTTWMMKKSGLKYFDTKLRKKVTQTCQIQSIHARQVREIMFVQC